MSPKLVLVVIKTGYMWDLKDLFNKMGLDMRPEHHGKGPVHYSTVVGDTIFEVYPLDSDSEEKPTLNRLGFEVEALDKLVEHLESGGIEIVSYPLKTKWGHRAIIKDVEGRKIELYQKPA